MITPNQLRGFADDLARGTPASYALISALRDAADQLIGLQNQIDRITTTPALCNRGHTNHLPVTLWDCPLCRDEEVERVEAAALAHGWNAACTWTCSAQHRDSEQIGLLAFAFKMARDEASGSVLMPKELCPLDACPRRDEDHWHTICIECHAIDHTNAKNCPTCRRRGERA